VLLLQVLLLQVLLEQVLLQVQVLLHKPEQLQVLLFLLELIHYRCFH
jgi:hypothetical protein